jgi:hypothetical protein
MSWSDAFWVVAAVIGLVALGYAAWVIAEIVTDDTGRRR